MKKRPGHNSGMVPNLNHISGQLNAENRQNYEKYYQNGNHESQMYNQRRTKYPQRMVDPMHQDMRRSKYPERSHRPPSMAQNSMGGMMDGFHSQNELNGNAHS